ncbi:MAG: hypothetical protein CVU41_13000 [Chloroflexi bacterium HGW-Chloroflexi-3]|nr:MAG: hypothetical protein CVU41_13000 [Chloroflexi bacterium HGW-Chloroflexi-3]
MPTFVLPIDNDSGANAYHARLIIQGEPLYGTHHPAHHLPGIYYTYALIFKMLGDHPNSLQATLIFLIWINGLVIIKIGDALKNHSGGVFAAVFFVLICSMPNLLGDTAEIELFANLPISIVVWLASLQWNNKKSIYVFILIGVFSAISFLFKAVYLHSFAAVGLALTLDFLINFKENNFYDFLKNLLFIFLGWALVLVPVFLYFYFEGLLPRFLLVFKLGSMHVSISDYPWYFTLIFPLLMVSTANLIFLIIGLVGVIKSLIYFPRTLATNKKSGILQFVIIVWAFLSIIVAGFSRHYFPHYALLIIPPLSLLVGVEIAEWSNRINNYFFNLSPFKKYIFPVTLVLVVIGNTLYSSQSYIEGYIKYRARIISLTEFVSNYTLYGKINLVAQDIAFYIKQNSNPQDTILTSTQLAQICYLANRRSSVDVLWPRYVSQLGSPERAFETKPVYVVLGPNFQYDEETREWLYLELEKSYDFEITFDYYRLYRNHTNKN